MVVFVLCKGDYDLIYVGDVCEVQIVIVDCVLDLILLDWMFLGISGLDLVWCWCKEVFICEVLIIMFIVCGEENDCVGGLEVGVDDYVVKFFLVCELFVCIWVVMCCVCDDDEDGSVVVGIICIDGVVYCVFVGDQLVLIGFIEYCLLYFFMIYFEWVYICVQLFDYVWGGSVYVEECIIDVYICCLCKMLELFGVENMVQIVCGVGYCFFIVI